MLVNFVAGTKSALAERVISRIKAEHRALARVLETMQAWLSTYRDAATHADFSIFEASLRYIDTVPERHHVQEEAILFPAVAELEAGRRIVAQVQREHLRGAALLQELWTLFDMLRDGEANALAALTSALDDYIALYTLHMRMEEERLLPIAVSGLSVEQWQRIAKTYSGNVDPLFGAAFVDTID